VRDRRIQSCGGLCRAQVNPSRDAIHFKIDRDELGETEGLMPASGLSGFAGLLRATRKTIGDPGRRKNVAPARAFAVRLRSRVLHEGGGHVCAVRGTDHPSKESER